MAESDSVSKNGTLKKGRKRKNLMFLRKEDKPRDNGNSEENKDGASKHEEGQSDKEEKGNEVDVSKHEEGHSDKEESDDNHSFDQYLDCGTEENGKETMLLKHDEGKKEDASKPSKEKESDDKVFDEENCCENPDVELCIASGVSRSDSVSVWIMNICSKIDLHKNGNGNYEWQWRYDNGWDEETKHESSDLNAIYKSWKEEKGFIIKTKHGYEWHTIAEEEYNNTSMMEIFEKKHDFTLEMFESLMAKRPRIVFIGPIGSGKSATINTLLREDRAPSANNLESQSLTKTIKKYETEHYILVDTPGLTEDQLSGLMSYMEYKFPIIVVIVIAASRIRSEEKRVINRIETHLRHYLDRAFLIITRGGDISRNEHEFLDKKKHKELYSLYRSVGKRCLIFENSVSLQEKSKYIDEFQGILKDFSAPKERSSIRTLLNKLSNFPNLFKNNLFGLNK